jgi:CheY-like chemotaxis protein
MIVDDDDGIREALAVVVSEEGCRVWCACNGDEALIQLRAARRLPCLILLDLMMPVMDGRQFRAVQMGDDRLSTIPVVLMTAGTVPSEVSSLQLLRKPLHLDELGRVLRSCSRAHLLPDASSPPPVGGRRP